jgi:hypothetical protein
MNNAIFKPYPFNIVYEAIKIAELRHTASRNLKCNINTTYQSDFLEILTREVNGILAELVIGRAFSKDYMVGINTFHKQADVGHDIEVRSSTDPNRPLTVRDNDDLSRRYVLVISDVMRGYIVKGWVYGYEAAQPQWRYEPEPKQGQEKQRPCWFYRGPLRPWRELTLQRPKDAKGEVEYRW